MCGHSHLLGLDFMGSRVFPPDFCILERLLSDSQDTRHLFDPTSPHLSGQKLAEVQGSKELLDRLIARVGCDLIRLENVVLSEALEPLSI